MFSAKPAGFDHNSLSIFLSSSSYLTTRSFSECLLGPTTQPYTVLIIWWVNSFRSMLDIVKLYSLFLTGCQSCLIKSFILSCHNSVSPEESLSSTDCIVNCAKILSTVLWDSFSLAIRAFISSWYWIFHLSTRSCRLCWSRLILLVK